MDPVENQPSPSTEPANTPTETPQTPPPPSPEPIASGPSGTTTLPEWPGAFGLFKVSREAVRRSLSTLVWLAVLTFLVSIVTNSVDKNTHHLPVAISLVLSLALYFVGVLFSAATAYAVVTTSRGQHVSVSDAFSKGSKFWVGFFLLGLLTLLAIIAGFIALVIPMLFVITRLALAPYFLVDKGLGPVKAFSASWAAMKGHGMKFWGIVGVMILMALPVITVVGLLATVYLIFMYQAAMPLLYLHVTESESTKA
jgi:hypothetical protein